MERGLYNSAVPLTKAYLLLSARREVRTCWVLAPFISRLHHYTSLRS
jgi:hypothetical protein